MKTKTKLLNLLLLGLYLSACGSKSKEQTYTVPDMHTSEMSVDWQGTYTGVTRAADCPGIYVMLSLDSAHYQLMNKYLDRAGIFIYKQGFKIKNDSIIIEGIPYRIGENILFNSVDTLYKQNEKTSLPLAISIDDTKLNKPINEVYTSKDGPFYDVLYFNDETSNFAMLLTVDRKECYILPQKEASAKGAIYEQDGIEWKSDNSTATLTKEGKSFEYKLSATLQ